MSISLRYVMERTEILCPECRKKKLLHEKDEDLYCDECGTEFVFTNMVRMIIKYKYE